MKFTPAKLLLLITNLGKGGAQRVFFDQSEFLQHHYKVAEAVFDSTEEERLYNSGLPLYSLDVKAGKGPLGKLKNLWKRVSNLKKLISQQQIDLVVSHMDGANWVNALAGKHKKILVVHGTVLHNHAVPVYLRQANIKWIIPTLYRKAEKVVAVSEAIAEELRQYCHLKNVQSIPNFFEIDMIQEKAAQPLLATWEAVMAAPTLITSGRLHDQKKQRYLLPLFVQIKKQHKNVKLIILGDGPLREALIQEAALLDLKLYHGWGNMTLGTYYDIYMPGYVSNPFQFLSRATVFVFPSGWEGFPLALCEAMICGVPVLSADCPTGPREILKPGSFDPNYDLRQMEATTYGYLLPMYNKSEFNECWLHAINEVLCNNQKRQQLIINGRQRMKAFDKAVIMQQWQQMIEEVLS
jgi:glycosyltransferase involved in cell wall biosynthesis